MTVEPPGRLGRATSPIGTTYALPETLGAEPETIARVVVTMSIEALRSMTIIDTPGLASANVAYSAATHELLAIDDASRNAVSDSDAVVFVFSQGATREDAEALTAVRRTGGGPRASAVHSIGVLSKVDLLGDGPDLAARADAVAARQAEVLKSMVATVVPVVGLLRRDRRDDGLPEADAQHLVRLASLDRRERERMLISPDRFRADGGDAAATAAPERLLALLDMFGIARCLDAIDAGLVECDEPGPEANRAVRHRSGQGLARGHVRRTSRRPESRPGPARARASRAHARGCVRWALPWRRSAPRSSAFGRCQRCTSSARSGPSRRASTGRPTGSPPSSRGSCVGFSPGRHHAAQLGLPPEASNANVEAEAIRGVTRWRTFVNGGQATTAAVRVADVVAQSYELVWAAASGPTGLGGEAAR